MGRVISSQENAMDDAKKMNWAEAELPDWLKNMNLGPVETWPDWVKNMNCAQAKQWMDWLEKDYASDQANSEREWQDWLNLCEEDDADRAYDLHSVEAFHVCCLGDYDLNNISHLGEIRGDYQWSRVWCITNKRFEWHWFPIEPEYVPEYEWVGPPPTI